MNRRTWIALVVLAALLAAAVLVLLIWQLRPAPPEEVPPPEPTVGEPPVPPPADRLELARAAFIDLPGWSDDEVAAALPAFRRSCAAFERLPDSRPIGPNDVAGTAADWREVCRAARRVPAGDHGAARAFFEDRFTPWAAANRDDATGLFTGYYEPTLRGSRRKGGDYQVPLYARPPELVAVDLGDFRDDLQGRRIAGLVEGGRLVPMPDRREIDRGALAGRGLEVVWVDDAVDAFFLHIQGSGLVRLDDGSELRVGYAAQNGHPYRAIGRDLVERGALTMEEVSLQSIRRWLAENPEEAEEVMAQNPSYVFFRRLGGEGPVGSQGVVLTPRRSLAVDTVFHPLGVPMWLDASAPAADPGEGERPFRRLLVAQDTGGAIRGPVRGDVFWGPGDDAESISGRMKHEGRLWLLLPKGLEPPASSGPPASAGDEG